MAAGSLMSNMALAAGSKIPLGIQMWTVKSEAEKDLEGTLRKLHALGFREIEFAGYYGKTAADLGKLLKSIGLTPVSTHAGADLIAASGDQVIADAKTLGLKYIICSSPMSDAAKAKLDWGKKMDALDAGDWKMNAVLFNKFGKQVKAAGMQFGYHNHHVEFKKFDGKTGFDTLFAATDADLVKIELDVGWAVAASQDPVAILNKYKGRVVALHVKDIGKMDADPHKATTVAVGEGTIDWKKVIGVAHANGVQHYFYEQEEPYTRPIMESAKMSADYLSKLTV
ncbi:MAG: sugar phosphate isomerase/epimerase [Pseudomonadota bacterium]